MQLTQEELRIVQSAVGWYMRTNMQFLSDFNQKHYRKRNGEHPTKQEIQDAEDYHKKIEALKEKLYDNSSKN